MKVKAKKKKYSMQKENKEKEVIREG